MLPNTHTHTDSTLLTDFCALRLRSPRFIHLIRFSNNNIATERFDRSCMQQTNSKDLLVVQWWWRGSRRNPPKTGTEIRPMERNFHGSRCPGHRGTPGTSPRQSRVQTRKPSLPAKTARHLAPSERFGVLVHFLIHHYKAFTSHFS